MTSPMHQDRHNQGFVQDRPLIHDFKKFKTTSSAEFVEDEIAANEKNLNILIK
jgi:hypothetical protein